MVGKIRKDIGLIPCEGVPHPGLVMELYMLSSKISEDVSDIYGDLPKMDELSVADKMGILLGDPTRSESDFDIREEQMYAAVVQKRITTKIVKAAKAGDLHQIAFLNGLSDLALSASVTKDHNKRRKIITIINRLIGRLGEPKSEGNK